jgi:hypothetical protein
MSFDRRDITEALASGALTFAWYALPDAVPSRRARAAAKVALMVPVLGLAVAQFRRAWESSRAGAPDEHAPSSGTLGRIRALTSTPPTLDASVIHAPADAPTKRRCPSPRQAAALAVGALALFGTVASMVATERGIHRYGQHLGARGVRLPHTRIGLVAALASGGLTVASAALDRPR